MKHLRNLWTHCGPELTIIAFILFVAWSIMAHDAGKWWPF